MEFDSDSIAQFLESNKAQSTKYFFIFSCNEQIGIKAVVVFRILNSPPPTVLLSPGRSDDWIVHVWLKE